MTIEFSDFSFKYASQDKATLKGINLRIEKGEKIVIIGPSGSGKSTLGQCLNGLIPHAIKGDMSGSLTINDTPVSGLCMQDYSESVGTVLQDTDSQFVGLSIGEDIAFALENDMISINSTQVISCLDLDEAVNFARDISEGIGFGRSLNDLSEAQKVLRDRSVRMLSNAQVWSRVVAAGRATPKNKTAFAYARLRTRKTSKTFSLDKCLSHLDQQIISAQGNGLDKFNDREMRKYVRDLADKMKEIQGKIHPKALPVLTSAQIYLKEISDLASEKRDAKAKATEIPERAQKDYDNAI
ncbi:ATP-binding cassette domain-containing protein [Moritella sp.]|uniref:ATP-binding cassette domain-containing protein n=1 Tax=Moritella sp. TaxID=78556 RepID=UPI0025D402A8|nr:ATP-binding cassette domain-containing protein [Moritella sp.]